MSARRFRILWRRARRMGHDLDMAGCAAFIAGMAMLLATGVVGPTIDAHAPLFAGAEPHAANE